ncbi:hypothetical protein DSL72_000047 [Monilinia vaccinii-corymbosi]|uniref:DUF7918 domain-containing protein n=1 Tax=Monilinia vaccinii-corymbosi TaxID=61207 RepID=A0A8A3NY90_9HELO|nr:hypothetical protein DSL72_000047 [Monilinia vaccinii-corymbosi]
MPEHKGVKLNIISQWDLKIHPEFPHPESTQFTFRSPKVDREAFEGHGHSPATKASDSKADRILGRQSSIVSVYIPSASGSRFFVRYNVGDAADQCPWFYFKLYMNGRHITSWGTNTKTRPSGQVMKALFEPDSEWDYKEGKIVYKNPGTEYRPFFFSQESGGRTAGDDGGLIEIQVFRARGRKRRNPRLEQYKDQTKYGVIMPTHGLVEKPQDSRFFDWHLKDAKDNPFATFKFHYRTWDNLQSLQLIPPDHARNLENQVPSMARHLMSPSLSMSSLNKSPASPHTPTKYLGKVYTSDQVHDSLQVAYPPLDHNGSPYSPDISKHWTRTSDKKRMGSSLAVNKGHRDAFVVPTDPPTEPDPFYISAPKQRYLESRIMPISKFSALSIDGAGSPSSHEWLDTDYNSRPLPEIPSRNSSAASRASAKSRAPSVTPSLLSYFDRDQSSPEPIIGTAIAVTIDSDVSEISMMYEEDDTEDEDFEDHDFEGISALSPPPSRIDAKRQGIISASPIQTSFSLPNVTLRKPKRSPDKLSPLKIPPRKESVYHAVNGHFHTSTSSDENTGTISLSESEWMRRTPSPVKGALIERLWSPTPEKREKDRLSTPQRMTEMMEVSTTGDDDSLEPQDSKAWDSDRGLDGGAIELVAMHHYRRQSQGENDGNVFNDYEINAMHMREGNIHDGSEIRLRMAEGNWI